MPITIDTHQLTSASAHSSRFTVLRMIFIFFISRAHAGAEMGLTGHRQ